MAAPEKASEQVAETKNIADPALQDLATRIEARNATLANKIRDASKTVGTAEDRLSVLRSQLSDAEKSELAKTNEEVGSNPESRKVVADIVDTDGKHSFSDAKKAGWVAAGIGVAAVWVMHNMDAKAKHTGGIFSELWSGIKEEIVAWAADAVKEPGPDADFFEKMIHKMFIGPIAGLINKVHGVKIPETKMQDVMPGGKDAERFAEKHESRAHYGKKVETLVKYMDGLKTVEQQKAGNLLADPVFADKPVTVLAEAAKKKDYKALANESKTDERTVEIVLRSFFPEILPIPVNENYAGYLFQNALQIGKTENDKLSDVINRVGGLSAIGSQVVAGFVEKVKNRDLSQESIHDVFDHAFGQDEKWFSEPTLQERAKALNIPQSVIHEAAKNRSIQMHINNPIGISENTNNFVKDTLRPFIQNIDLSTFGKIHPNINVVKLKELMQRSSIQDALQLYILMGKDRFDDLSEDAQGLTYIKLWSMAGEDKDLQGDIGKILTDSQALADYTNRMMSSGSPFPERLRRFMTANFNKAMNSVENGMSNWLSMLWNNFSAMDKMKIAVIFGTAIFFYARFRFLLGAVAFGTVMTVIMGGVSLAVGPEKAKALEQYKPEIEAKLKTTMGEK